jgi:hypothetical protein
MIARIGSFEIFVFFLFMTYISTQLAIAQKKEASSTFPYYPRYSKISFSQDLNIFQWNYVLNYQKTLNNQLQVEIAESFRSTLQRISAEDLWKDNQDLTISFRYPLANNVSLKTDFFSHLRSDPLAGFDNDVTLNSGSARIIYRPSPKISISPVLGSKWQTQLEQSDHGVSYGWDAQFNDIEVHGYKNDLTFLGAQDVFPQRINQDFKFRYKIERSFYEGTADTLIVFYERLRRDSFGADVDGLFIRNLTQSYKGLENRLSYSLAPNVSVLLKNSLLFTTFKVNNLRDKDVDLRKDDARFESSHALNLRVQKPTWFGNVNWSIRSGSRDDRRPQEKTVDPFKARHPSLGFNTDDVQVVLSLQAGSKVTSKDSLGLYSSVSRFQYDTSDTTNPNSHDQLRWHFNFSHERRFSKYLRLQWRASVFLNHFVYISSKFSSGNNWERVFQLMPVIYFQPSENFKFKQSFTVRAKYQTYDFDDPETSNRNIVNRQFILTNTSNLRLSSNTWAELKFHLEFSEQGKLFYQLWRQRLALSWRNQEIQILFRHKIGTNFVFAPGASFFHQLRWDYNVNPDGDLEKKLKGKHTNLGPVLEISYRPSDNLEVAFLGNTQIVYSSRRPTEHINNFDVNLNWFF